MPHSVEIYTARLTTPNTVDQLHSRFNYTTFFKWHSITHRTPHVDDCGTCADAYLTLHSLAWGLSIV